MKQPSAVLLAALSGFLFGLGGIFSKLAVGGKAFTLANLLASGYFWVAILVSGVGLVFWFWALYLGRVAIVGPFMSGFMIAIPTLAGMLIMGEPVSALKCTMIVAIFVGAVGLSGRG
jgi:uncharacterized membrane protein